MASPYHVRLHAPRDVPNSLAWESLIQSDWNQSWVTSLTDAYMMYPATLVTAAYALITQGIRSATCRSLAGVHQILDSCTQSKAVLATPCCSSTGHYLYVARANMRTSGFLVQVVFRSSDPRLRATFTSRCLYPPQHPHRNGFSPATLFALGINIASV